VSQCAIQYVESVTAGVSYYWTCQLILAFTYHRASFVEAPSDA